MLDDNRREVYTGPGQRLGIRDAMIQRTKRARRLQGAGLDTPRVGSDTYKILREKVTSRRNLQPIYCINLCNDEIMQTSIILRPVDAKLDTKGMRMRYQEPAWSSTSGVLNGTARFRDQVKDRKQTESMCIVSGYLGHSVGEDGADEFCHQRCQ